MPRPGLQGRFGMLAKWALALAGYAVLAVCLPTPARAEDQSFCNLQKIDIRRLSNGVRIELQADGLQDLNGDISSYWGSNGLNAIERIKILLPNVRGGVAPLIEVAQYPVSHMEFALIPGSRENIGLQCTLVLYRPGFVTVYNGSDTSWERRRFQGWPQVMITRTPGQDTVVIMVLSDEPGEPVVADRPEQGPPGPAEVWGAGDSLSVKALQADLDEIIMELALRSGQAVYLDDQIEHRVSANLEDKSLEQILRSLALCYGLTVSQVAGAWHVSTGSSDTMSAGWLNSTHSVPLTYLKAKQALLLLPRALLPYMKADVDNNRMILSGPAALLDRIERDLRVLDKPGYQCRLRAYFVSCEGDDAELRTLMAQFSSGTMAGSADSTGCLTISVGEPRGSDLLARLQHLADAHRLKLQSTPSLTCVTGSTATLFVGDQIYYWRLTNYYWGQQVTLKNLAVGSSLTITPQSSGDWVSATVAVDNSLFSGRNDLGPVVLKRRANSQLRLKSGDMLIVGSLLEEDHSREHGHPVPGLWPADALFGGVLKTKSTGEVYLLLQAESFLSPPPAADSLHTSASGVAHG